MEKRNFLKRETDVLGYRVINAKLYPFPLKTKTVMNFLELKYTMRLSKDIQNYLGLREYFRIFIRDYSATAKLMDDLLKKYAKYRLNIEERKAF